jgi:mannitol/fructose-specific phosphotransferase system IIA component (Ntr-type)
MKLGKLLDTDRILLDMKATEHLPAIIELVDFLTARGEIPKDSYQETLKALEEREALISTGIGSGVAIPHTFSDCIDKVVAIFGRSKQGINFQALDNAPVHLIILFIVPSKDYQLHLRTLAAIAKMLTNSEVRRRLAAATTCDEILEILDPKAIRIVADKEPC